MVKIFTMVKGEVDIVREWIIYHGELFGYNNLFVIDNFSLDGTWEILQEYKNQIHLFRLPDYKLKGIYMTKLIKRYCENEFAFPIDIDEFIVLYDKKSNTINCETNMIHSYLRKLPLKPIYKMNYISSKLHSDLGYINAVNESLWGNYDNYGSAAKSFIQSSIFTGTIDHGNHMNTNNYVATDLCLVHYHSRNLTQMHKKIYNNVKGFNYPVFNLNALKQLLVKNPQCPGNHHVRNQISVLEKTYKLPVSCVNAIDISLTPILEKMNEFKKNLNNK